MWRSLLESLTTDYEFAQPATWAEVSSSKEELGTTFPEELENCLRETNGIVGQYGLGLIWPLDRIVRDNLKFRSDPSYRELYMPFDPLLFFGDAGNGDQFAYSIQQGVVRRCDVFVWNHENDSRTWVAPSLARYIEWWLNGTIKL